MTKPTAEQRIELIKWGVKFAEGFELKANGDFYTPGGPWNYSEFIEDIFLHGPWENMHYPLFLDRVCQGINRINGDFIILQGNYGLEILEFRDSNESFSTEDIGDQAREAALLWLMEEMEG